MVLDKSQIFTPGRVSAYTAPVGTVAPTAPTGPFAPEWRNVGHTTPDSLQFETSPEFEEFRSAQSDYVVKKFQTSDGATIQVDLAQWNAANFKAAFGGGTVTAVSGATGVFKFVPPRIGEREDFAMLIHVREGAKNYLYVIPQTSQTQGVTKPLHKGAVATLPLRVDVIGGDDADPWYLLTDDEAFDPAP